MRVRKQTSTGDFSFGHGAADYFVNQREAVAQEVLTALLLFQGEWFMDTTAGMPWLTKVVGRNTDPDTVIKSGILNVQAVTGLSDYSSSLNNASRGLTVSCKIDTQFGTTQITVTIPLTA